MSKRTKDGESNKVMIERGSDRKKWKRRMSYEEEGMLKEVKRIKKREERRFGGRGYKEKDGSETTEKLINERRKEN